MTEKARSWLDPTLVVVDGDNVKYPPRRDVKFIGVTVADDPDLERTIITGVGGGSPSVGSAGQVQTSNGSGAFAAPTNVFAGAGYISVGATPATFGALRLARDEYIYARDPDGPSNVKLLGLNTANEVAIQTSGYNIRFDPGSGRTIFYSSDTHVFESHFPYVQRLIIEDANMQFGPGAGDYGGGDGVFGIDNAATVPTSNPTNGVVVYAEGGLWRVRHADGTVGGCVVFDDDVTSDYSTVRSAVTHPATIDNTKHGIVSFGAGLVDGDSPGDVPYLGVIGKYATCVGGAYPSCVGDYSGGGGYRPNARGMGSWAFGYSSFADGECCFSAGRSNVSGAVAGALTGNPALTFAASGRTLTRASGDWAADQFVEGSTVTITGSASNNFTAVVITVTTTVLTFISGTTVTNEGPSTGITVKAAEQQYCTTFGRQVQARGQGSFGAGYGITTDIAATYCAAFGLNCIVGPAGSYGFVAGNQSEVHGRSGVAMGEACIAGAGTLAGGSDADGCVALGYHASATGSTAVALGNHASADHTGGFAAGTLASVTAVDGVAIGKQASSEDDYGVALGYGARATAPAAVALGQGTVAKRYSELAHSGFPEASGPCGTLRSNALVATSAAGATENLLTPASAELSVEDGKSYLVCVLVLGSRTDAQLNGAEVHTILCHATGGTLTIDSDTVAAAPVMPGTWSVAISAPSGLVFRVACTGHSGHTVRFAARVDWIELEGF
jgi:hypothetical protein